MDINKIFIPVIGFMFVMILNDIRNGIKENSKDIEIIKEMTFNNMKDIEIVNNEAKNRYTVIMKEIEYISNNIKK